MAIVLPPFYYLDHFTDLARDLDQHCRPVLESEHLQFLDHFFTLSKDAQCLFVRLINRKGTIFEIEGLKYQEIQDFDSALEDLRSAGWVRAPGSSDKSLLLQFLTANALKQLFKQAGQKPPASAKKADLIAWIEQDSGLLDPEQFEETLLIQEKSEIARYLYFLYFGQIQSDLTLYTLSDLGIRRADQKRQFKPRFDSKLRARTEYFFASSLSDLKKALRAGLEAPFSLDDISKWPVAESSAEKALHDEILLLWAGMLEKQMRWDEALRVLGHSLGTSNAERKIRLLYKKGDKEQAFEASRQLLTNPASPRERLFAQDFLERKTSGKKTSRVTDALRGSRVLQLDDIYFRRPEKGVRDWFREQGHSAHIAENHLWSSLFGLFFWDELFEGEGARIYNRFERRPKDLIGGEFLRHHQAEIEAKLGQMQSTDQVLKFILQTLVQKFGTKNEIFIWHPNIARLLTEFLKYAPLSGVLKMLQHLALGFDERSSGYPDLFVVQGGEMIFLEVKAEGDKLQPKQLAAMEVLKDAGFRAEVCRVDWQRSAGQCYVVVDVETTGGRAGLHRVTEIGAVKICDGQIIDQFQTLLNPERAVPRFITQLTGISNEMVADAPLFQDIMEEFEAFTKGAIFVAHNVTFDYGFIQSEFERQGRRFTRPKACTVAGMRRAYPGLSSYSLKNLCRHFAIKLDTHHRALCDARAAAELFLLMDPLVKKTTPEINV